MNFAQRRMQQPDEWVEPLHRLGKIDKYNVVRVTTLYVGLLVHKYLARGIVVVIDRYHHRLHPAERPRFFHVAKDIHAVLPVGEQASLRNETNQSDKTDYFSAQAYCHANNIQKND